MVPCIRLDWMTDEERRAYALAHNRTAELSGWDYETVEEELRAIQNFDMSKFGFEGIELAEDELSSILEDKPQVEKEPKRIQCPVCGEWFEL
jgi:site-specific DNA-methyltransferase (adenine-specific)